MKTKTKIGLPLLELQAKIATAVVIKDADYKALSSNLAPGTYSIDAQIRIAGGMKKGEPYLQRIAAAANPWALLAKALSKLNSATIESLVTESLAVDDEEATAVKAAAQDAIAKIVAETERECSGKVTGALTWELV